MAQSETVHPIGARITMKPISGAVTRQAIRPPSGSTMPSPVESTDEEDEIVQLTYTDNEGEQDSINIRQHQFHIPQHRLPSNRLTKTGKLDRRYKGQRDIPDEEVINPDYRKASVGGTDEQGVHITVDGKLDRRFIENRSVSDEEAELKMAEAIIAKYKNKK